MVLALDGTVGRLCGLQWDWSQNNNRDGFKPCHQMGLNDSRNFIESIAKLKRKMSMARIFLATLGERPSAITVALDKLLEHEQYEHLVILHTNIETTRAENLAKGF